MNNNEIIRLLGAGESNVHLAISDQNVRIDGATQKKTVHFIHYENGVLLGKIHVLNSMVWMTVYWDGPGQKWRSFND